MTDAFVKLSAWVSKNSNNVGSRSVSAAIFNSKILLWFFSDMFLSNGSYSACPSWGCHIGKYIPKRRQASL